MIKDFLPMSRAEMEKRGWDEVDFVYNNQEYKELVQEGKML